MKKRLAQKTWLAAATLLFAAIWAAPPRSIVAAASQSQQASPAPPATSAEAAFARTADEVMAQVSDILGLPVKTPLKKTIRSRDEIREYLLRQMREDKNPEKRYADQRALEKFGLLPKGFQLEPFLIELLTEQIAGLYDPKGEEFYIADWLEAGEQRMVMAHELVHALHDQHFQVDKWLEAAKPNDDAELARGAVLEGAATAAMIDYVLRGSGQDRFSVRTMPNFADVIRGQMVGDGSQQSPQMAKAPPFIREALLFPYLHGAVFTQKLLQEGQGWPGLNRVFEKPPVSTQQILHPELYLTGVAPQPVTMPDMSKMLPAGWRKLDENVMGEFGLYLLLKQSLGEERAARISPGWAGDRYAVYENKNSGEVALAYQLRFSNVAAAARFFGAYSEALEMKYKQSPPRQLFRRPNFFSFATTEGPVFLHCWNEECIALEGVSRSVFDRVTRQLRWPAAPAELSRPVKAPSRIAALRLHDPAAVPV